MPLSWANAFRPTIALLYCTGNEVTAETSFDARVSMVASTPVQNGMTSLRTRIAITTSSSEALPARSLDFLERSVAGTLADAVDGAFDLTDAGSHACER